MIQLIKNNQGIALVTSLMLTLITLTMVMALLYIVTQGIKASAQNKSYRTAVGASYGGSSIVVKDIMPIMMQNYSSSTFKNDVQGAFTGVNLQMLSDPKCMQSKLIKSTADWPSGCSNSSDPKKSPDMQVTLKSQSGNNPFIVTSKIVDTVPGNSDTSGFQLEGSGVAENTSTVKPMSIPYIYRMEVQGEQQTNSTSRANLEVLYAY